VEAEEEIAAIVVVGGVKVDVVAEEEVGARLRRGWRKPLCFHETIIKQRYPGFAILLEYRACMNMAGEVPLCIKSSEMLVLPRLSERLQIWGDSGFEDWNGYGCGMKMYVTTEMAAMASPDTARNASLSDAPRQPCEKSCGKSS
jgi:hypothetical protein